MLRVECKCSGHGVPMSADSGLLNSVFTLELDVTQVFPCAVFY
jgi:hypothetical protein